MNSWQKLSIPVLALLVVSFTFDAALAQKRSSSGSSRPSSSSRSSSSSFKSSSGSTKPSSSPSQKFGSPSSSSSKPKAAPPSSSSSSKFGSPNSNQKPSASTKPPVISSKPSTSSSSKFGSPNSSTKPTTTLSSKFGSPNSSEKPSTSTKPSTFANSKKPSTSETDKSKANKAEASKQTYVAQQKATAPPKTSYTSANGKTVKIDPKDKRVESIRSKPSTYYNASERQQRTVNHIHTYHYSHPYDYYYHQPYYHVGGGYSSVFWWMMMEWNAERRAAWLYHNRDNIERSAYEEGVKDAEVRARLEALEKQKVKRDPNYVDAEYKENPTDMYDAAYIEAAYNPTVQPTPVASVSRPLTPEEKAAQGQIFKWVMLSMLGLGLVGAAVWFVTSYRFGK